MHADIYASIGIRNYDPNPRVPVGVGSSYLTALVCDRLHELIILIIFDEVTGEWRKLRNEELRDLYPSPSVIRIIKSRRMRWAGHVARMGEKRNAYRLLVGKPEGK
jgi:hypothetical protein